ncbi:MAG TPA: bifunctional riboflavin kinase/FAD synthetase [Planctomycetaceae bacterium]|nr:bifunctional riboflavin kinase/FAD synthetase [Planctomycetaceae bacterium]
MNLFRSLDDFPSQFRGGAVSIGNFDGVHAGHARLVAALRDKARQVAGPAVVFTLDPHPARVLRPEQTPPSLSWTERKAELLERLGVDAVIAYPTDRTFLRLDPVAFFERVVVGSLQARAVVEGPNFYFGSNRSGDLEMLGRLCSEAGMVLEVAEPVRVGGEIVSSSRIRRLVGEGAIEQANRMLTEPYRIRGVVVRGEGRGRQLGYPTANLSRIDTLLPGEGIYAARAWVDGAAWPAALSLGPNLTFGESEVKVEAYLVGYEGVLYDRTVEVDFLARLRDIERFSGVDSLIARMRRDVEAVERIVAAV